VNLWLTILVNAFREIRRWQKSTALVIPRASFRRLCREVVEGEVSGLRIAMDATFALQEAAESHLVTMFESKFPWITLVFLS
jgi:histone H3